MSEHTPSPTPHRAIYGFAFYVLFYIIFIFYLFWTFVPETILIDQLGLTYMPDKYFVMFIPVLVLFGLAFFGFFIYPAINLSMTADPSDSCTIQDRFTIKCCKFKSLNSTKRCNQNVEKLSGNDIGGWYLNEFCEQHSKLSNDDIDACDNDLEEICIENYCECVNKEMCRLKKDKNHIEKLKLKPIVPRAYDLSISEACQIMYRNK